ncbi:hypothetical protein BJ741DRAFT_627234 [Chytriomyces cf. hyalinus JEL632]|nr:hypothetical protein BJ741DRAFT_627234 [Chytriomyces cf. hyalinus JEL632]
MQLRFWTLLALACTTYADTRSHLELLYASGKDSYAHGDFKSALIKFGELRTILPQWPDIYANIAVVHMAAGDADQAFDVLRDGIALLPSDASLPARLCSTVAEYFNRPNDFPNTPKRVPSLQKVISACMRSVELDPENAVNLQSVAATLTLISEYSSAISVFETWIEKFGHLNAQETLKAKSNLAATHLRAGNTLQSYNIYKEVMDADPSPRHVSSVAYVRSIGWPMDKMGARLKLESTQGLVSEFHIMDKRLCPEGIGAWRLALNYSDEAQLHPDRLTVQLLNPETAYNTYGRLDDPILVGKSLPEQPFLYHERYIYLVHLKNAFMSGHPGIIHSDCVVYAGSHHANVDLQTFPTDDTASIIPVHDPTVSIIQHQTRNYYHWILEAVPKLLFLLDTLHLNLQTKDHEFTKILVPEHGISRAIDETLDMPEFINVSHKYIRYQQRTGANQATRYQFMNGLHVVDWMHPAEDTHGSLADNLWGAYWPPREALHRVRAFFHDALKQRGTFPILLDDADTGSIVYVSRQGKLRGFPNEDDLLRYLKQRFGETRVVVHRGNEALLEQVAIFAKARVVVGNHGAGLANYVFTQAGKAAMVFVPMDPHVEFCFSHLVAAMDGVSYVLSDIPGAHYYGSYSKITKAQMKLMGDTIETAHQRMMNSPERDEL